MNKNPIFCAIDTSDIEIATNLISKLKPHIGGIKLGLEFFTSCGISGCHTMKEFGLPLFIDLKLYDIPNTVVSALRGIFALEPEYTTLHISGGEEMLKIALKNIKKFNLKTKVLGVTLLTSLDGTDSKKIYGEKDTDKLIKKLALIASKAKIAGLICSGQDLKSLKSFKKLLKVTPGVKLLDRKDDQKRVSFVHDALNNGANFVVIGRELINAKDPMKLIIEYNKKHENKNLWTK